MLVPLLGCGVGDSSHVVLHVPACVRACRCLRAAIREELMSISPDTPAISDECKAEVGQGTGTNT